MTYDTTGKRIRTENLAGQATATAWDCCHKITFAFPFDDIDNWRSSLERRVQSAEHVANDLNQYTSIEQLVLRSFSEGGSNNFSPLYDADGVTTKYAYDAAGRLVKEGNKTYSYGYLDKVLSVTEGARKYAYDYHVDGQLARADYGGGRSEDFEWDGLALVRRGDERFVNEPHVGGGNPVVSSKGTAFFNDMLGTTVGAKTKGRYSAAALTAFGEDISAPGSKHQAPSTFFTGKPQVAGLGHAFLFRNYRAGLAKWQTADPMGYPDGWNQLAYCGNDVMRAIDFLGGWKKCVLDFEQPMQINPCIVIPEIKATYDIMGVTKDVYTKIMRKILTGISLEYGEVLLLKRYIYSQIGSGAYGPNPPSDSDIENRLQQMGIDPQASRYSIVGIIDFDLDAEQKTSVGVVVISGIEKWRVKVIYE